MVVKPFHMTMVKERSSNAEKKNWNVPEFRTLFSEREPVSQQTAMAMRQDRKKLQLSLNQSSLQINFDNYLQWNLD